MQIQVSLMVDLDATTHLETMEQQIQAAGHQGMRQALQQAVRTWEHQHLTCPRCGSSQTRLEGTVRRTVAALFGVVRLARQRRRCQHCWHRFAPAKGLLAQLRRGRISPGLEEAACLAGASWPYRSAAQVLARLSGARISAEQIRLLTNAQGRRVARRQEQEAVGEATPATVRGARSEDPGQRTIIGLDGGWVPNRERRGGMEGKVGVVARDKEVVRQASEPPKEPTWIQLERWVRRHRHPSITRWRFRTRRYVATFAPAGVLGPQVAAAVVQVAGGRSELVVLADGAQWIKTQAQRQVPNATCILDWPHLWRTMAKAVRAMGLEQGADQYWVHRHLQQVGTCLWQGQVEEAKGLLEQWQREYPGRRSHQALTNALRYLRTQRDWIGNYEAWKQQGYPIGSGIIERAVALVINRRMKRQGMSWLRRNATAVVALRVAFLNEQWDLAVQAHGST